MINQIYIPTKKYFLQLLEKKRSSHPTYYLRYANEERTVVLHQNLRKDNPQDSLNQNHNNHPDH